MLLSDSLTGQNMEILGSLAQPSSRVNAVVKKSNLNNLLMQLRKFVYDYASPRIQSDDPDQVPSTPLLSFS